MLFKILKRTIERGNYSSVQDMQEKLSILFANDQITASQYEELLDLLG